MLWSLIKHTSPLEGVLPKNEPLSAQPQDLIISFQGFQRTEEQVKQHYGTRASVFSG